MFSSLKTKLILLVSGLVFGGIVTVGLATYLDNVKRIEAALGERALGIAKTSAIAVDGDHHQMLAQNIGGAGDMDELESMREVLREIKVSNDLQTDVYTYIKAWWVNDKDTIVFLASSNEDAFAIKGQDMEPYMKSALEEGNSGYSEVFTTVNGEWITGYSPIFDSEGNIAGVVEVALETSEEVAAAKHAFIKGVTTAAAIALIIGIFFTFIVSTGIAKPIISLNAVTKQMASGDLQARANISGRDEVAQLGNDFNDMAANLERSYKELENYSKNLEKMVEERTAEVVAGKKKIQKILNHIEQGILTFDSSLKIDTEFSAFLSRFYGVNSDDIAGKDVFEFIFPHHNFSGDEANTILESIKAIVGSDSIAWDFNSDHLPTEVTIEIGGSRKIIATEWTPMITENDEVERLMLAMRDLTHQRELEAKMAEQEAANARLMGAISQLVSINRDVAEKFFSDTKERLQAIHKEMNEKPDYANIFRDLHTIKGGARLIKAKSLMDLSHETEDRCHAAQHNQPNAEDELNACLRELSEEFEFYLQVFTDVLGGGGGGGASYSQATNINAVLGSHIQALQEHVEAKGGKIKSIECLDEVIHWQQEILSEISDVMIHGLVNSADHGYLANNKRANEIELLLVATEKNDHIQLQIIDRGEGIDEKQVVQTAIDRGLITKSGDKSVTDILFEDGFSMATVQKTSGRGVGLSAIKGLVKKINGTATIQNNEDGGTCLSIKVPNTKDSKSV